MPSRLRPRRGSLQYWPRKRAKRIYPSTGTWPVSPDAKPLGFAGWKAGMTHVKYIDNNAKSPTYGKIISKAVTIVESPSLFVCGIRFYKKTNSSLTAIGEKWFENLPKHVLMKAGKQKGSGPQEKAQDVRIIVSTQPEKSGMKKNKPEIFEIGLGGDAAKKTEYAKSALGKEFSARDIFTAGEYVDVSAVTKGHGFEGPIRRFGIRHQTRKDSQMHRHTGSIGPTTPGKLLHTVPLPGQYGFFERTEYRKRILQIDNKPEKVNAKGGLLGYGLVKGDYILVEGSVPGPNKRLIRFRKSVRPKPTVPVDVKYISVESKQGV